MSQKSREARQRRIRAKVTGTAKRPRANVYRSRLRMHLQLIDDTTGQTLLALSSPANGGSSVKAAQALGESLGQAAVGQGITQAVFDRGGFLYHGRIKAVADGLRKGGLKL